jgi:transposase
MSRGGRTTKIHARVDAKGRPVQIELTPGNIHDCSHADVLLEHITAKAVIADKGYDSDAVVETIEAAGAIVVIPSKSNRKVQRPHDKELYKERNLVERFFNRLKHWRGLATRYEKTIESYLAMVHLVCARLWLTPPSFS